jgi:N-acetylglucosaminyldiphosphoundecaprenol N-acetyl-beta-D-mannosaminyltransferase
MKKIRILNIDIHNYHFKEFLERLEEGVVVTPNIDHLIKLQSDREFYDCYRQSEYNVCDSRVVQLISKLLYPGRGIVEQINGSDLLPAYCLHHKDNTHNVRIFLLGGTNESVKTAKESLNGKAASKIVVGAYSPPFGFENDETECNKIIRLVNESSATALAVGVGAPKQEKWIQCHKHKMPDVKIFFGVGAAIDFEAGRVKRAPRWVINAGFEWFYRMTQEPRRLFRRYLIDDSPFFWLALKQRMGMYKNPWM